MKLILYIVLYIGSVVTREIDYCFVNEPEPYKYLGVKTPYRFVHGQIFRHPGLMRCRPLQIWFLARHGTRYPQGGAIKRLQTVVQLRDEIVENHDMGRGRLCEEDFQNLKQWTPHPNLTDDNARRLSTEGFLEGVELGRRLKLAYPELLQPPPEEMTPKNYLFETSKTTRGMISLMALMEGIFGYDTIIQPVPTQRPNMLLQPDMSCRPFSKNKTGVVAERDRFIAGPEYKKLQEDVSRRLGFNVTPMEIHNMQDMCRFETAWTPGKFSPWCGVFSKDEWKIMEYIDDLQYYWGSAYGRDINKIVGCFPVQDLFQRFRKLKRGETREQPRAIFYFTTSRMLMNALHVLEIAKDPELLRASNFRDMDNRKWRTSTVAPFFGNFIATFYSCKDTHSPYKVTFHVGEKLVMYEGCQEGLCDWEYLEAKFATAMAECTVDRCREKKDQEIDDDNVTTLLFIVVLLFFVGFSLRRPIVNILHRFSRCILIRRFTRKS